MKKDYPAPLRENDVLDIELELAKLPGSRAKELAEILLRSIKSGA